MRFAIEVAVRGASLAAAGILLVALVHKASVLASRRAERQPVLAGLGIRGRGADVALLAAGAAEAGTVAALAVAPVAGLVALAGLVLVYAGALRSLDPDADCRCFGELAPASARVAIWRNAAIAVASLAAAGACAAGVIEANGVDAAALGVAVVLLAGAAAPQAQARLLRQDWRSA